MKKVLFFFLLLAISGGAIAYYYIQRDSRNDIKYIEASEEISASALFEIYNENENQANNRFLGKIITVLGQIQDLNKENGKTTITLDTGDPLSAVVCEMNASIQSDFSMITTGQKVSLKGQCSGKLMDIILVNCIIN